MGSKLVFWQIKTLFLGDRPQVLFRLEPEAVRSKGIDPTVQVIVND